MEINRHLRILFVLVAVSFGMTTLSFSPAWAATSGSKQTLKNLGKRHVSTGARRIKQINGSYVAQNKPQNVANPPAAVCYGRWEQSLYGPVYVSWCPATVNSGTTGQTGGWATPAGASSGQTVTAPATGGYTSQPPPANVSNPPGSVCYSSCVPCWTGPVYSWSQPATAYSATTGQTGGWAAPAQAPGNRSVTTPPATGGYVPSPPPPNVGTTTATACNLWSWSPCAPVSVQ